MVAGAGNWLLGHDRIGPRVLEAVATRYGPEVELCDIGTTALALLDHLHGQRLLVVVDACIGRGHGGELFVVEPNLEELPGRQTSVHQIGPLETLIVARHLFPKSMPQRVVLLLVETADLDDAGEARACERVVELLDGLIDPPMPPGCDSDGSG